MCDEHRGQCQAPYCGRLDRSEQPNGGCSTVEKSRIRASEVLEDPMLEHADGSKVHITLMTVILKSLGVVSASDKMA